VHLAWGREAIHVFDAETGRCRDDGTATAFAISR
jgi:hypothetical protein